jgi:FMN phosphatase YigB (HAD superfamily)
MDVIGGPDPGDGFMVDDRADNIAAAVDLGLNGHHYQGQTAHLERALLGASTPVSPHLCLATSAA